MRVLHGGQLAGTLQLIEYHLYAVGVLSASFLAFLISKKIKEVVMMLLQNLVRVFVSPRSLLLTTAVVVLALCGVHPLYAQISHGGAPHSFELADLNEPPVATMPAVNVEALRAEDQLEQQQDQPVPLRFGKAFNVSLGLEEAGEWTTLSNGDRLWRLRIASQGAYSINLIFDQFFLPPGAQLFLYDEERSTVRGAFTEENNKEHGKFSTAPIKGSSITLEYYEPKSVHGKSRLRVSTVVHAYRDVFNKESGVSRNDFGDSDSCHINVNCSGGNSWQDEKRAVAMIINGNGNRICTGALVNNEREDLTPYFLTADHCLDGNVNQWVFVFNYESPDCSNTNGSTSQSISGATLRANNGVSDFALLELDNRPPAGYDTYYAGWNMKGTPPKSSVGIHHPNGDIKKIALDYDAANSVAYGGGNGNTHWEVSWDDGITAVGSSGSPLFDQNHRIVGQLHGGTSYCSTPSEPDWYGKFSMSWDYGSSASTRLKDWLDPDNTGIQTLDGREGPSLTVSLSGPNYLDEGEYGTWHASASGGTGSYSYDWEVRKDPFDPWYSTCPGSGASCTWGIDLIDESLVARIRVTVSSGFEEKRTGMGFVVNNNGGGGGGCNSVTTNKICLGLEEEARLVQALPDTFSLGTSYPNPARERATIKFALPEESEVRLTVYDVMGREVARPVDGTVEAGYHEVKFNAADLPSGVYLYRMRTGHFTDTGRLVVVK